MACAPESSHRERLRGSLMEWIEPVSTAGLRDFFVPAGGDATPTPTRPNACRLAAEHCRSAGLTGADLKWAMPALYYAAALSDSLRPEPRAKAVLLS
jgi:hypothetical protein